MASAAARRPRLEVPNAGARESSLWAFLGGVALPVTGVALLALAVGWVPRLVLETEVVLQGRPGVETGSSGAFQRMLLPVEEGGAGSAEGGVAEAVPALPYPVVPVPVARPSTEMLELPPLLSVEDETSGPPLAEDVAALPLELEATEPAAGPGRQPRAVAALPGPLPEVPVPDVPESPVEPVPAVPASAPEAPPVADMPEAPPVVDVPEMPPVANLPEAPPVLDVLQASQVADLSEGPPVLDVPEAPPVADLPETPPVADLPETPPVADLPEAPSVVDVPEAPQVADLPEAPPVVDVSEMPQRGAPEAEPPQVALLPPGPGIDVERLLPAGRGSGHRLLARLAATAASEACEGRALPYFRVVETDAYPARLPAGGRFSHRVVYALCPAGPEEPAAATVTREIRGGAGVVLGQRVEGFRLRPGTWASDEELTVPPDTVPGRYRVVVSVRFGGEVWTAETDLLIE